MAQRKTKKTVKETAKTPRKKIVESKDKFQQMLEYLVNEDNAKAEELFHDIVVEKSRQIYENILAEEVDESDDEEVDESDDEEVDESDDDELDESKEDDEEVDESDDEEVDESDDEEVDENFNLDEFEVEGEPEMDMDAMGGDPTDDMEMDMDDEEGDMDMDADMGGDEPVTQDDIKDLEAELADLKAEFEELMADQDMGDMDMDDEEGDMDMDDEEGDMDMDDDEMPEENFSYESKENMSSAELMREYVNKIGGEQYHQFGKMGDNGANSKSVVAGKNDMGGTSANIVSGTTENGVEAGKGNLHGNPVSDQNPKDMNTGNVNVPGNKKAPALKPQSAGHGAERKSKPETADKSAGPVINGAPNRAK